MTDREIMLAMMDRQKMKNLIASMRNGHRLSGDILQRAHVLHNTIGAPAIHWKTGEVQQGRMKL